MTETDALAACLDQAELEWPQELDLLVGLALAGAPSTLRSPAEKARGLGLEFVPD
jgi:hypothetical protein